ncbi:hypothetical protein HYW21_04010 [Candidatus Woesearchaeota archaeon]|nr:hypothetical protein [Candidatus Woesearchaeota archaeon]
MEAFQEARAKALHHLKIAGHMLEVTYPLVKDTRLLLRVLHNLDTSLEYTMKAILGYDLYYKRIPPFSTEFQSLFATFRARCARRYNLGEQQFKVIQEVRFLIKEHKESPVAFARKGSLVMCSDSYDVTILSVQKLRTMMQETKFLIDFMNKKIE